MIQLVRPLVILDVETTGYSQNRDRIVQIGFVKICPPGCNLARVEWSSYINPGMHIPKDVADIHGITDEKVAGAPIFGQVAAGLADAVDGCDVAGYCVDFDIRFIKAEYARIGLDCPAWGFIIDVYSIYKKLRPRKLVNAYLDIVGEEMPGAHDALGDSIGAEKLLMGMLAKYEELPRTVAELGASFSTNWRK